MHIFFFSKEVTATNYKVPLCPDVKQKPRNVRLFLEMLDVSSTDLFRVVASAVGNRTVHVQTRVRWQDVP